MYADKEHYNLVALNLDRSLQKLSGQRILEVSLADEQDGLWEACDTWIEVWKCRVSRLYTRLNSYVQSYSLHMIAD